MYRVWRYRKLWKGQDHMTRNEARENMMKIMYEMDAAGAMDRETADRLCEERLSGNHIERGRALLGKIIENMDYIDEEINRNSRLWKTGRMPKVDLAIMRLAVGEIKYCDDIPDAVAVSEAISIAEKYSTGQSSKFIHGVLGAVTKK